MESSQYGNSSEKETQMFSGFEILIQNIVRENNIKKSLIERKKFQADELKKDCADKSTRMNYLRSQIGLKQEEMRQITQSATLRRSNLDRLTQHIKLLDEHDASLKRQLTIKKLETRRRKEKLEYLYTTAVDSKTKQREIYSSIPLMVDLTNITDNQTETDGTAACPNVIPIRHIEETESVLEDNAAKAYDSTEQEMTDDCIGHHSVQEYKGIKDLESSTIPKDESAELHTTTGIDSSFELRAPEREAAVHPALTPIIRDTAEIQTGTNPKTPEPLQHTGVGSPSYGLSPDPQPDLQYSDPDLNPNTELHKELNNEEPEATSLSQSEESQERAGSVVSDLNISTEQTGLDNSTTEIPLDSPMSCVRSEGCSDTEITSPYSGPDFFCGGVSDISPANQGKTNAGFFTGWDNEANTGDNAESNQIFNHLFGETSDGDGEGSKTGQSFFGLF